MNCGGLEQRLAKAIAKMLALTPAPGRGKRQFRSEAELLEAARVIARDHRVEGLINLACAADRPRKVIADTRCQ